MKCLPLNALLPLYLLLLAINSGFSQSNDSTQYFRLNTPLPTDPEVKIGSLPNGLTYYIRKNKKPENRAELRLVVNAGSVLEDDDQLGLAHFVEHMAFNGTAHFDKNAIVDYLESIGLRFGPDLNAYTSFDETVYMLQIPTGEEEILDKSFLILQEWASRISFEAEEIEKERGVVIEEWRLGREADARMRDKILPVLLKDAQYARRLPIGKKEVLENFAHEALTRYYKEWYRPELMAVVAVGDFDIPLIEKKINTVFAQLPVYKHARERKDFTIPDHDSTLVAFASDEEAAYTTVSLYYKHGPEKQSKVQDYRRQLLENLYHTMLNQRLSELLRKPEPPFIFASTSYGGLTRNKTAYTASAVTKETAVKQGLEALLIENQRVKRFGFTFEELKRAKKQLYSSFENLFKEQDKIRSDRLAAEYVRHFLAGEPVPGINFEFRLVEQLLPGIMLSEVNQLADKWLIDHNRVVIITGSETGRIHFPTEGEVLALLDSVKKKDLQPYKEEIVGESLLADKILKPREIVEEYTIEELGVTVLALSNQVKVILKPTDFKNNEILLKAFSDGGHSIYPDQDYMSAIYADVMVREGGLAAFSKTELDKFLAGKRVNVSPYIDELKEGFSGYAAPDDIETLFQMIYLYFWEPRKDTLAYQAFMNRAKEYYKNLKADPQYFFSDTLSKVIAQNHPRRFLIPNEAQLREIELDKALEVYRDRFAEAGDFSFLLAGNISVDSIKPLITTYLGNLPSSGRQESWQDVGVNAPDTTVKVTVRKGLEDKSTVRLIFTGPFEWTYQNRFDMYAMSHVLKIKLREVMREDKGGVYGVGVSAAPQKYPDESYRLTLSFGCSPDNVEALIATAFEEIKKIKEQGVEEKDIQKVKEIFRKEREVNLKENHFWIRQLEHYAYYEEDPLQILAYDTYVDKLESKALQKAAQKYFNEERYLQMVLMPEE